MLEKWKKLLYSIAIFTTIVILKVTIKYRHFFHVSNTPQRSKNKKSKSKGKSYILVNLIY